MTDSTTRSVPSSERTYFRLDTDFTLYKAPLYEWISERDQRKDVFPDSRKPFEGIKFREPPRIRFDRRERTGSVPDAHLIGGGMWLVSDRLKALFERLDPEALVFQRTEVDYSNFSQTGSTYWLSYFIRELDCVDEEQSALTYYDCIQGVKVYRDLFDIKMRPEAIGSAHAFRLKYGTDNSIVDDLVVSTMNVEGITGFKFVPIQKN